MPIGRPGGGGGGGGGLTVIQDLTALEYIPKGAAVAALSTGIRMCSASDDAARFIGFTIKNCNAGEIVPISGARGAVIQPVIEGGATLSLGQDVFLSETRGEVTTTPPFVSPPAMLIRLGAAFSTTQFVLATDVRITLL
jgi:hypothetical protein